MADRRFAPAARWALLGVVLIVSLVIGSGVFDRHAPTPAERISSLEARIKCPSCQDLSVAQSTSPSSLAVRADIVAGVRHGRSDDDIIASLRERYGTQVDLTPQGGLSIILWVVPALMLVVILVIIGLSVRRRGRLRS